MRFQEIVSMVSDKLKLFDFEGQKLNVNFIESMEVTTGVTCDVYEFEGDKSKDLGIVEVQPGCKTPLQRILDGEKTIEGYVSGKGTLTITKPTGKRETYTVGNSKAPFYKTVTIGELMQWQSSPDSKLIFYEICYPPYKDGRFQNLPE